MAIAPLRFAALPPPARPPQPPRSPAPEAAAIREAGRATHGRATALERELEAQKAASLELRLIRAMLLKEKPELAEAEAPAEVEAEFTLEQQQSQAVSLSLDSEAGSLDIAMEQTQRVSLNVSVDAEGEARVEISIQQSQELRINLESGAAAPAGKKDPLVLDLDGDGLETSGLIQGQRFDIDGDGQAERVSVASGGDAFLALDADGNGRIDDGRELFGDQNGAANGFAELARHDGNGDGQIDALDPVYARLRLLGFAGETPVLTGLAEAGIARIDLAYREDDSLLASGDQRVQRGSFQFADGRSGEAADLLVHFEALA